MSALTAFAEQLLNGLTIGIVYVLLAAGLSIIFGVMDVINFAHGELFALGAYFAFSLMVAVGGPSGFWIALVVAPVAVALVGGAIERLTIRPLYGRNPLYHILLTFGFVLIFKDVIEYVWEAGGKSYPVLPVLLRGQVDLLAFTFPAYNVFVIVAGSLMALGTWLALNETKVGLIVRAGAEDREMVRHLGIDVDRYYTLVFAFGAGLAAVAGIVLGGRQGLDLTMGDSVIIPAFVIVVLGGLGSFRGAVVGGLLVGVIQTMIRSPPVFGEYVPEILEGQVIFLLMIGVLLVRPEGLFGAGEAGGEEEAELLTGSGESVLGGVWRRRLGVLAVGLLALAPLGVGVRYSPYMVYSLLANVLIWALFALSLDFVMGYVGLVSLGHVLFYGLGAYVTVFVAQGKITDLVAALPALGPALADGMAAAGYSQSVFFALGTAMLVAAAAAWVVGHLSIRVAGVYFAMITLAFAELVRNLVVQLPSSWTGSSDGLYGGDLFYSLFGLDLGGLLGGSEVGKVVLSERIVVGPLLIADGEIRLFYYFVLAAVVGSYLLARRIMAAPFGSVLQAIRESEQRAAFLGYDVTAHKRRAFVISGGLAALAGGLQAITGILGAGPSLLHWIKSGEVIVATMLGGMGTLYGPMLGAGVFVGAEEFLGDVTDQWQAVLGVLFVLFVIFVPRGLVSLPATVDDWLDRLRGGGGQAAAVGTGADADASADPGSDAETDGGVDPHGSVDPNPVGGGNANSDGVGDANPDGGGNANSDGGGDAAPNGGTDPEEVNDP